MMTDWLEKLIGETETIVIVISLLIVAILSETLEWVSWFNLRHTGSLTRLRRYLENTSLMAGTASIMLFGFFLTGFRYLFANSPDWVADVWIFGGMVVAGIGLIASPFCRSRLRLTGVTVGVLMSAFWFELWTLIQFARAYPG